MAQSKTGYVDVGGARLYYQIGGPDNAQTLVLNHAGFVDSGQWDYQWDAFTEKYRVIRYDMRGLGKSDLAPQSVSRRDDLYKLLTQLGVSKTHVLGESMGGEIVIDFTLEHPDMVTSLIAVSATPSGFEMQGEPPRYLMEMMETLQKGDLEKGSELQLRIWIDGEYREPNEVDPAVRKHAAAMNKIAVKNGTFFTADSQPLNPLDPPAVGRLSEIHVPTLLIAGALDNSEIVRAADVMASEIENAQKLIIADAAHMPSMEKPAEFNRAVMEFLKS